MVYGLNGHEQMPMDQVFKKPGVGKISPIAGERSLDEEEYSSSMQNNNQAQARKAYTDVQQLAKNSPVLLAEEVMTSPVVTLSTEATISDALSQFHERQFRHLPVISSSSKLVGVLSDRDILRYMSGINESYQQGKPHTAGTHVKEIMTPRVLTASTDTDLRYIARLFVEQHIGSIPIAKEGSLKGIITRGDLLRAVMNHYTLELWA